MNEFKLYTHYLYWILIFSQGLIQLFLLPTAIYKVGIPLLALVIFSLSLIENKNYIFPNLTLFMMFLVVAVISNRVNSISVFQLIYFIIYALVSYLYAMSIINEKNIIIVEKVKKIVIIGFLIQIPVAFIKYLIYGVSEQDLIGTLSTESGSISSIFPLFAITILFSYYLFNRKKYYIILILGYVLFGIIGAKRVIAFYIPIMLFVTYLIFLIQNEKGKIFQEVKRMIFIGFISILTFIIIVKTNKSLNPEHSYWGSFNLEYVLNYSDDYTTSDKYNKEEMRRKEGLIYFFEMILSGEPVRLLLGDGAGKLIQTEFIEGDESMLGFYGVRYGGRMGSVWLVLQVGFIGVFIYLLFILNLYKIIHKYRRNEPMYLAFPALIVLFIIDSITYSETFLKFDFLKGVLFLIYALLMRDIIYSQNLIENDHEASE